MPPTGRTVRAGEAVAGVAAAGGFAHTVPALVCLRRLRSVALPGLAGVGARDHVALTFDDGPDPGSTPAFLDELDRLGVRATFFLLGCQVRRAGSLTAEIVARGHELGVHGETHVNHLKRPPWWAEDDVRRARDLVEGAAGTRVHWFRPPYGAYAASSIVAARSAGLRTVLWTTWGRDWRANIDAGEVVRMVRSTMRPGATVLLHDSDLTSAPGSWRRSLGALPELVEGWHAAGLGVGPLAEHGVAGGPLP
ncbi:MAG: polysaccharide deacetylase family protein [Acidimicrobiales bacterium]